MSAGRTSWWPKDAAFHRRELIVELGEEFAAGGPNVMDVICAWAQEQRAGGEIRGGFRILARESFVSLDEAQAIVTRAGDIGLLDELSLDADGRRFTCRVSGWEADQSRGRAALRKADERARDAVTSCHAESQPITVGAQPNLTRPDLTTEEAATPQRARAGSSRTQAESVECPRCRVPAGEKCAGVRGPRESCHLERHHAVGELTHIAVKAKTGGKPDLKAAPAFEPDPEWEAIRVEHFPDSEPGTVESVVAYLRQKRQEPTVEAIREMIEGPAAA